MDRKLKQASDKFRQKYYDDEIGNRIKRNVHQQIQAMNFQQPKRKSYWIVKKLSYVTAACLVMFGLFIGSAFVSPAMADVASTIPLLNKVFKEKPVEELLYEKLIENGYAVGGMDSDYVDKKLFISIEGSEQFVEDARDDIKELAEGVYASRGYDAYTIEVTQHVPVSNSETPVENQDQAVQSEKVMEVLQSSIHELEAEGFEFLTYGSGPANPKDYSDLEMAIHIDVPHTENRLDVIEQKIEEDLQAANINDYTITFYPVNRADKEIESTWRKHIFSPVMEVLGGRSEYKTNGYAYAFKDGTMNFIIKTTVDQSDPEAAQLANKIKTEIDEFLTSEDVKNIVKDTPYNIIVRDKNGKDIE